MIIRAANAGAQLTAMTRRAQWRQAWMKPDREAARKRAGIRRGSRLEACTTTIASRAPMGRNELYLHGHVITRTALMPLPAEATCFRSAACWGKNPEKSPSGGRMGENPLCVWGKETLTGNLHQAGRGDFISQAARGGQDNYVYP